MIEVPIYIPAGANTARPRTASAFALRTVAPASAIVSDDKPWPDERSDMVIVYYEGNLYGASNMVTFADRAMFAYWRMRDHYPTVATMAVKRRDLKRVATLYPEYGRVEVDNALDLMRLLKWIGCTRDELASELRVGGVRIGAPS